MTDMKLQSVTTLALSMILILSQGCANPHFFPRLRPLFPGLDESRVPAAARGSLEQAKADFRLAKAGRSPQYARYVSTVPHTQTRKYQGHGYMLTLVNEGILYPRLGPEIVVDSSITGGKPFQYDEVDEILD